MTDDSYEAKIISLQVGLPRTLGSESGDAKETWTTGFFKQSVDGPIWLGARNLDGDGQADLVHHGGPDKAVCVYSAEHFAYWPRELSGLDVRGGAFGENFAIAGLTESEICIGDIWEIGDAQVQVSQPRQPCWKLARRWKIKDLALRVQRSGRTGWYFRVLQEGLVASGLSLNLLERPHAEWTIAKANHIMHHDETNLAEAARLAAVPLLSASWSEALRNRVKRAVQPDERKRLNASE